MHSRLTRWANRLLPFNFETSHKPGKDVGFTNFLSRLTSGKAISPSYYDEEFIVASIDKILNNLSNRDSFYRVNINSVDNPSVAVNTNTFVDSNIPWGVENSSEPIGHDSYSSFLATFNHEIIAAIISSIAQFKQICAISHIRSENCSSNCLPLDNSNFNCRSITSIDKVLLYFLKQYKYKSYILRTERIEETTEPFLSYQKKTTSQ